MPERRVRSDGRIWKACPSCGVDKPHDSSAYYRAGKHRDGTTKFYTRCKACVNAQKKHARSDESETAQERHKRRARARQRAWVKLGQRHREEFRLLYEEELVQEYIDHGPMPPVRKR